MSDYSYDGKTVTLTRPHTHQGQTFSSVRLRGPKLKDLTLGKPAEWQRAGAGNFAYIQYPDVMDQWITRLAVEPTAEALSELPLPDALLLQSAVMSFFSEAETSISAALKASSSGMDDPGLK
jgi:hypothetical protein